MVDEFLASRPSSQSLRLVITTRDQKKSVSTITRLYRYLARHPRDARNRIYFQPEQLDLVSLSSVRNLAQSLLRSIPRLDAILLNAGIGGFTGINWLRATWDILTNFTQALTTPTYKLSAIGLTAPLQIFSNDHPHQPQSESKPHPPLAEVFCANVFGHYLLAHFLSPILSATPSSRIIWISSIEAHASAFSATDIQGLSSPTAYETSKRLTDILVLTSSLASTHLYVSRFLSQPQNPAPSTPPKMYLAHPGICATSILPLPLILQYMMILIMSVARWIGSPWHTVRPYKGACAPVWLALGSQGELNAKEAVTNAELGKVKWGSSTDRGGNESIRQTEVEGYGFAGEEIEGREAFDELGKDCWRQMEELREEWEARIWDIRS